MRARRNLVWLGVQQATRQQGPHVKPLRPQESAEQPVLLETITAAPPAHELLEDAVRVGSYGPSKLNIEIFESDRSRMRPLQPLNAFDVELRSRLQSDPLKIFSKHAVPPVDLACANTRRSVLHQASRNLLICSIYVLILR